jgi:adenylate cyclase
MVDERVKRRLAAILAADVVGYSRLMGEDEAGTLARLTALRRDLIEPVIAQHHGRVVKLMGDGLLVEFASVVDAVICAIAWQDGVIAHEMGQQPDDCISFRIGINHGDIIVEGDDIYGDGVNVAARLQELADAGGVSLSAKVHTEVVGKTDATFVDDGEHRVKNIAKPLRVYSVKMETSASESPMPTPSALPLPDKPSIAVLPFENMSGDPEQEYFSDGITEDIITELSRYPDFLVIARNSTFVYKHNVADHRQIARNLGVQFLLEGSVRRAANRVRISAQLIDASTGAHLWAERYDRTLDDIFAVQDEITGTIVGALGETLQETRIKHALRKDPSSLDAYDKTLQAWAHFNKFNKADNAEARHLAESAIELDPGYARAYAILARTHLMDFSSHWADDPDEALKRSYEIARKAVSLDDHSFYAYVCLGMSETWLRRHDQAIANMRRAIELNFNDADSHAYFANLLVFAGRPDEALEELETTMRLNPHYPGWYLQFLGRAYFSQRRYEEAESAFERVVTVNPGWPWAHLVLAATRTALGRTEEARAAVAEARKISPAMNLGHVFKAWPARNPEDLDHLVDLLREAGLPE